MDHYAPLPTTEELEILGEELGYTVRYDYRIVGGLGGTMDVLRCGSDATERIALKRYWLPEHDEIDPSESEFRALNLAVEHGVRAPAPLWIDRIGLFPERAIVMSFLEGTVLLDPVDPLDWAAQLAQALAAIHGIDPVPSDDPLFPIIGHDDDHSSEQAVKEHPLGMELWTKRTDAVPFLVSEVLVYVHHDFWPGNTLWIDQQLVAVVDWEGGSIADPALDVAYCALDIRLLGMDRAADHFLDVYRETSGRPLFNLEYWNLLALCRPMPDIAQWVPGWRAMGFEISPEEARQRHAELMTLALKAG
jgi:aminoglycoside phosphotransferase (APT) family kinase protein